MPNVHRKNRRTPWVAPHVVVVVAPCARGYTALLPWCTRTPSSAPHHEMSEKRVCSLARLASLSLWAADNTTTNACVGTVARRGGNNNETQKTHENRGQAAKKRRRNSARAHARLPVSTTTPCNITIIYNNHGFAIKSLLALIMIMINHDQASANLAHAIIVIFSLFMAQNSYLSMAKYGALHCTTSHSSFVRVAFHLLSSRVLLR